MRSLVPRELYAYTANRSPADGDSDRSVKSGRSAVMLVNISGAEPSAATAGPPESSSKPTDGPPSTTAESYASKANRCATPPSNPCEHHTRTENNVRSPDVQLNGGSGRTVTGYTIVGHAGRASRSGDGLRGRGNEVQSNTRAKLFRPSTLKRKIPLARRNNKRRRNRRVRFACFVPYYDTIRFVSRNEITRSLFLANFPVFPGKIRQNKTKIRRGFFALLTRRDHVEHAGIDLLSRGVRCPASHRAVIVVHATARANPGDGGTVREHRRQFPVFADAATASDAHVAASLAARPSVLDHFVAADLGRHPARPVERPLEHVRRRIRVHLAHDFRILVPGHAVRRLLVVLANGLICGHGTWN